MSQCLNYNPLILFIGFALLTYLLYHAANQFMEVKRLLCSNKFQEMIENYTPEEPHPAAIELYKAQTQQRIELLRNVKNESNDRAYYELYNALVPEVFCLDLVRIGSVSDGGKWMCNPHRMRNMDKCTIYSLGINNEPSFEESLQTYVGRKCSLRCFDKDDQKPETNQRIKTSNGVFMKALISSTTDIKSSQYSFSDLLPKFGDKRIDILKVDIEEAEFLIQDQFLAVPICQLLIEVHPRSALDALNFLRKLSKHGFYLFSYEINGAYHYLCEYSFIHENCFEDYGVKTIFGKYLSD
ncbi:methyltransferase domain-containing protein [Ditylenchus destructor]|nr:methyltransferase domain-containing protein [Ditylenchus destructor]